MILPDAIGENPRSQRIARMSDPARQFQTPHVFRRVRTQSVTWNNSIQYLQACRCHFAGRSVGITAASQEGGAIGLTELTSPDPTQRFHRPELPLHPRQLASQITKLFLVFIGRREPQSSLPKEPVIQRRPIPRLRHRSPILSILTGLQPIFTHKDHLRVIRQLGRSIAGKDNAPNDFGLGEPNRQRMVASGTPPSAESTVIHQYRPISVHRIDLGILHRARGACGDPSIRRQSHISRLRFIGPNLKFVYSKSVPDWIHVVGKGCQSNRPRPNRLELVNRISPIHLGSPDGRKHFRLFHRPSDDLVFQIRNPLFQSLLPFIERTRGLFEHPSLRICRQHPVAMPNTFKRRAHPIVVLLFDRIEFMIVALRAIDCHPEKGRSGGCDHVIQRIGANQRRLRDILITHIVKRAGDKKCHAHFHLRIAPANNISSQMLQDETIERFILVKRTNHVITKGPEVVDDIITFIANALAKANHV